ncbi:hypothetical protein HS088_TW14G01237 [Tripterygium wilfordii]|uniref:Uncharacterized protein n=1 Tax=Tripterygium wilfordii TaxID=458696 RepID=A0A7J7CSN4_TRIWF|nr:hypothetical protein HS088_TW14G01237 [Tripterygium wilfordii]
MEKLMQQVFSKPGWTKTYLGDPDPCPFGPLADGFPKYWTEIKPPSADPEDIGAPRKLADVPLDDIPGEPIQNEKLNFKTYSIRLLTVNMRYIALNQWLMKNTKTKYINT